MGPELRSELQVNNEVFLRVFREEDAEGVLAAVRRNLDHLRTFMEWATPNYSIDSAREFIANSIATRVTSKGLGFGIFKNGEFVGSVGFVKFDWDARTTEIGYWIDKAEEGRGIVSASCGRLIEYAFGELSLNRIEIRCAAANVRSAAIPERLGFKKEGVLRQVAIRNGVLHDYLIFGLLSAEWNAARLND